MLQNPFTFVLTVFFGFFAIMNPIANTPIFLGLAENFDKRHQKIIAMKSVAFAFIIVAVFIIAGKLIFELFGITLPAFRITGGILIFYIGTEMLQGQLSKVHTPSLEDSKDAEASSLRIAISPLAVPILAGPGTISTAMNFVAHGSVLKVVTTVSIFGLMCFITYWLFIYGEKLISFLGDNVVEAISRLMGLLLAVIGTEMVILGVKGAIEMYK